MALISLIPVVFLAICVLYIPCSQIILGIVRGITYTLNNEHERAEKWIHRGILGLCFLVVMIFGTLLYLMG